MLLITGWCEKLKTDSKRVVLNVCSCVLLHTVFGMIFMNQPLWGSAVQDITFLNKIAKPK